MNGDMMSRPKPEIVMSYTDPKTYKSEQILRADAVYAVFFNGEPINLRSVNSLVNYPGPKYKKSAFSNPGHSFNLAEKLNRMFKTTKFEVYKLISGKKVSE